MKADDGMEFDWSNDHYEPDGMGQALKRLYQSMDIVRTANTTTTGDGAEGWPTQ